MKKTAPPIALCLILWLAQLVAEIFLGYSVLKADLLPLRYLGIVCLVLALLLLIPLYLMTKPHRNTSSFRILAMVLSALIAGSSVWGSLAVNKVSDTLQGVSGGGNSSHVVGIYVRADDPAQSIADAKHYSFAVTSHYDAENSQNAVAKVEEVLNSQINQVEHESALDMVEALLNGEVDAMVLNKAYASLLDDNEDYEHFSEETRLLYECYVENLVLPGNSDKNPDQTVNQKLVSQPMLVYISGSDTRNEMLTTSRSDVNILAAINPQTHQILLVSTPRDYWIPTSVSNGVPDKLTHCGIYGIDCSIDTLEMLYGVNIDYYGQINFTGFERLVDAVGGVDIESDQDFITVIGGYHITKGINHLNGAQALGFVRERKHLRDGDNDRGRHQMLMIKTLAEQTSATTLMTRYNAILDSIQGMFITDMSSDYLEELVKMQVDKNIHWDIKSYLTKGEGARRTTYSMPKSNSWVALPDEEDVAHVSDMLQRVLSGGVVTDEDLGIVKKDADTTANNDDD